MIVKKLHLLVFDLARYFISFICTRSRAYYRCSVRWGCVLLEFHYWTQMNSRDAESWARF